jgi:Mg2+ and Co2+ transporter CorA
MCDIVLLLSASERTDFLRRLTWGRRHISVLQKVLQPKREMLRRMLKTGLPHLPRAMLAFVRDPLDHATRMKQQLVAVASLLESSLCTYEIRVRVGRVPPCGV